MKMKRMITLLLCLSLLSAAVPGITGCGYRTKIQATDLMAGIQPGNVVPKEAGDPFRQSSADFALRLFGASDSRTGNRLISPLSVMLALAMTANGAQGETKEQMEQLLGGDIPLDTLNAYLCDYVQSLTSRGNGKLSIANSIWFREGLAVNPDFLQKNADYYRADAYQSAMGTETVRDINRWVRQNTDGMIDRILDTLSPDTVMCLVNTVLFDAEWQTVYTEDDVRDGTFTTADGTRKTVSMMHAQVTRYLEDTQATGFLKPYRNGCYFLALLPNEGVPLEEYVASLSGEHFLSLFDQARQAPVRITMPKFDYTYEIALNDTLQALGLTLPFDPDLANFRGIEDADDGNLYISRILHKAHITVGEKGTRAGAATAVLLDKATAPDRPEEPLSVTLDRPFLFAIVDGDTGLPIFIGTVADPVAQK